MKFHPAHPFRVRSSLITHRKVRKAPLAILRRLHKIPTRIIAKVAGAHSGLTKVAPSKRQRVLRLVAPATELKTIRRGGAALRTGMRFGVHHPTRPRHSALANSRRGARVTHPSGAPAHPSYKSNNECVRVRVDSQC